MTSEADAWSSERWFWRRAVIALASCSVCLAAAPAGSLRVVDSLDLNRYVGKWYEVARLPNWFQRKCVADTTATYTLRPNGSITVLNQCRMADGRIEKITGTAKRATENGPNAKLRVSFFWPIYGDYWVIDLDSNYQWAVVGEPRRRYLWVLSRNPSLDRKTLEGILDRARAQGYDLSSLMISSR